MSTLKIQDKVLVCGAQGMVGRALVKSLQSYGISDLLIPSRKELDATRQDSVEAYLKQHQPNWVVVAAAKVGGIYANSSYKVDFLYDNVMIAANLIKASYQTGVENLLFLGSTCIYPKLAPQPIVEESILTSALESTNEAYALAKIVGLKLCEYYKQQHGMNYFSAMPSNLYGPGDNYHVENSHVLPALIRKFHEAKEASLDQVVIWGTGKALREFMYVDDLAQACVFLMGHNDSYSMVNIGSGEEVSILDLAKLVGKEVGFEGKIVHDLSKPDGTPRKKTDLTKLQSLGWKSSTTLQKGIHLAYQDFLDNLERGSLREK
jgi:GDP-L-fucose synthase